MPSIGLAAQHLVKFLGFKSGGQLGQPLLHEHVRAGDGASHYSVATSVSLVLLAIACRNQTGKASINLAAVRLRAYVAKKQGLLRKLMICRSFGILMEGGWGQLFEMSAADRWLLTMDSAHDTAHAVCECTGSV